MEGKRRSVAWALDKLDAVDAHGRKGARLGRHQTHGDGAIVQHEVWNARVAPVAIDGDTLIVAIDGWVRDGCPDP